MPTGFLVLGTPRSGTSAAAGVLSCLGIDFGRAEDLLPASEMNPRGFFQSQEFEELFDGDTFMPEPYLPYAGVMSSAERSERLRYLLRKRRTGGDWGLKSVQLQWLLPEIVAYCRSDVKIVRTRRAKTASTASWKRWSEDPDAAGVVKLADVSIDYALSLVPWIPVLEVPYSALVSQPKVAVGRIAAFAGRPVVAAAVSFVEPALNHYDG